MVWLVRAATDRNPQFHTVNGQNLVIDGIECIGFEFVHLTDIGLKGSDFSV